MASIEPVLARFVEQVNVARTQGEPLEIRGGATKRFYGETPRGAQLDVRALAGVVSYEPTELVVTTWAGTSLSDLEALLTTQGQYLPFEPPRFAPGGTVGGMVAAGLSGPARATAGSVRDHVLGVRLLTGRGELLTFGGQVSKNVAGYDVSRLVTGSMGILGVICEVSLKVLPQPRATATLVFDWDALRTLAQFKRWASRPLPINATVWHQEKLYLRLAGARAAVEEACASLDADLLEPAAAERWWLSIRDQTHPFFGISVADEAQGLALWRLSVSAVSAPVELAGEQMIEWHGALRWLRTTAAAADVRAAARARGGHAVLMHGADRSAGVFAPLSDALLRIHRDLKHAFDPAGILNPGRFYPGL